MENIQRVVKLNYDLSSTPHPQEVNQTSTNFSVLTFF